MTKFLPYIVVILVALFIGAFLERVRAASEAYECVDTGECIGIVRDPKQNIIGKVRFYHADKVTINES